VTEDLRTDNFLVLTETNILLRHLTVNSSDKLVLCGIMFQCVTSQTRFKSFALKGPCIEELQRNENIQWRKALTFQETVKEPTEYVPLTIATYVHSFIGSKSSAQY